MTDRRVLLLGDSWMCGLSSRKGTMGRLLAERVGATEVLDLSAISRTTTDMVRDHLDGIDRFAPDLAILAIGGADSLIFPTPRIQRVIDKRFPPEWAGVAGLQTRALYSRDKRKRRRQRVESWLKTALKQVLVNLFGGHRRVSLEEFDSNVRAILGVLAAHDTQVVVLGFSKLSHWTSPKSDRSCSATLERLRVVIGDDPRVLYVPVRDALQYWDEHLEDRVHLNPDGHRRVAETVVAAMTAAGGPWANLVREQPEGAVVGLELTG